MPKQNIDYSNTIFYKIYCKDANIKELYIGHTTNFVQRKYCHKQTCNNEKYDNHNLKVYKCIRNNGGWDNWKMEIIGFRECYDHYEARKIEQQYFESLNATLNSIEPLPKPKPRPIEIPKEKKEKRTWYCNVCETTCQTEKELKKHQETNKHKRSLNNKRKTPKNAKTFLCDACDFKCSKQSDYMRHLMTLKHKILTNVDNKTPKNATYICDCGKEYKHRQSLYVHKKKCVSKKVVTAIDSDTPSETTIEYLLKENLEMKQMMMEMMGKMGNTTNNINNNNTQNNHFNINMFLNETCKDAINFSDFVERIEVSHDDLENNAQLGFVNGITKILMDNLKLLTVQERPIHCTDVKRETLYIKDEDKWNKDKSVEILENAIKEVSRKSIVSLSQWKKTNPDYNDMDSEFSRKCIPMQKHSMGFSNKDTVYPKIIHNLAKENTIHHLK